MWRRRLQGYHQFLAVSTEEKDSAPNAAVEGGEFWRASPSSWDLIAAEGGVAKLTEVPQGTTGARWSPCVPGFVAPQQQDRSQDHGGNPGPHTSLQGLQHHWCSWYSRMSLTEDSGRDQEDLPPQVHHHFEDTPQYPSGLSDPSRISWSYRTTPGPWLCPHLRLGAS